jgi:SNF2 family DNA or RNA helicase
MDDAGQAVVAPMETPALFTHQKAGIETVLKNGGSGALFFDPGTGKTRTALEIFDRLRNSNPKLRLFVFCPLSLIEGAWRPEIKKYFGDQFTFSNCHKEGVDSMADIMCVNYEFLVQTKKLEIIKDLIRGGDWMAVLDESSKIKNHKAITTKALLSLRLLFKHRIVMSGTPAPNDETEYWGQIEFVRPGILFDNFSKFRNTYFRLERNGIPVEMNGMVITKRTMQELFKRGAEYKISADNRSKMFDRIGYLIHSAKKDECLDLPEQVDELRLIEMGPDQKRAYKQMKRDLITQINEKAIVAQVALTKLMKLREITSGFAMDEDGSAIELKECPKLKELEEILDELGDRQAIIWGQFTYEIKKIRALLAERGAGVATLFGETLDKTDAINAFIDGRVRYLVAHPASAAHGLTFVNCSHQIFFSIDYSWERYEQARARTHRAGQKQTCVYYHILAAGTIDEEILEVLRKKGDMQDLVFRLRGGE